MKGFLKKRWHSIPIGIITAVLILGLVAGSVFAAYNFFSFTTEVFVDEPLSIEYNLDGQYGGDWGWYELGDEDSLTLERSAGDDFAMRLRITNDADNPLTVDTVITGIGKSYFSFAGWPVGSECPNGATVFDVTADVNGDAPPGTYYLTFTFQRS